MTLSYTTVLISVKNPVMELHSICLNTGALHTLISCSGINGQKIKPSVYTKWIHGISDDQKSSEYMNLCLYILSTNSKIMFIVGMANIINKLKVGLLIDMNLIRVKDMVLDCGNGVLTIQNHTGFTAQITIITVSDVTAWHLIMNFKAMFIVKAMTPAINYLTTRAVIAINWLTSKVTSPVVIMLKYQPLKASH